MTDTHYMADQSMIPPLPMEAEVGIPHAPQNLRQGSQRPADGVPKFYFDRRRVKNEDGSVTFKMIEMVAILTPCDPKATPHHKVTDRIREMYPVEYEAFRKGVETVPTGKPLELWSALTQQQVHAMKALNIFTVEQVAEMADSNLHRIPMGRTLKNQAQAVLKAWKDQDSVEAMRQKDEANQHAIRSLEDNNMQLQEQLAKMQAQLEALSGDKGDDAPSKRGPGRPRKEEAA